MSPSDGHAHNGNSDGVICLRCGVTEAFHAETPAPADRLPFVCQGAVRHVLKGTVSANDRPSCAIG
jgi:hypothetical protein